MLRGVSSDGEVTKRRPFENKYMLIIATQSGCPACKHLDDKWEEYFRTIRSNFSESILGIRKMNITKVTSSNFRRFITRTPAVLLTDLETFNKDRIGEQIEANKVIPLLDSEKRQIFSMSPEVTVKWIYTVISGNYIHSKEKSKRYRFPIMK